MQPKVRLVAEIPLAAEAELEAHELTVEVLFRRYFDDVYRMVARLVGPGAPDADIEDITQQVFVAVHRALPRFRGDSKVTTWLYGIASRVVLVHLRSWRRQRRLRLAVEAEADLVMIPGSSLHRQTEDRQRLAVAWRHLMRIKPKKRVVYVLHIVEGRSAEEIAAMLDIPVGTVWTRIYHAKKELAASLARSERTGR